MNPALTEQVLVASCLDAWSDPTLTHVPGPAVCQALAFAPDYWHSVEAGHVARGLVLCEQQGLSMTLDNVESQLGDQFKRWLTHPMFSSFHALPLSVAEVEAKSLLPLYKSKQVLKVIRKAYIDIKAHPEATRQLALDLRIALQDLL